MLSECESNGGLTTHIDHVVGEPNGSERKEHSNEKDNYRSFRGVSPGVKRIHGIRSLPLRFQDTTEGYWCRLSLDTFGLKSILRQERCQTG